MGSIQPAAPLPSATMRAMARVRSVDVYPFEGFPERMWGCSPESPGDPLIDAFLRAARPVVALYTEALERVRAEGPGARCRSA